ncbi:MAG: DUF4382 domain-containing protein [Gemmatimonadota bacterium]
MFPKSVRGLLTGLFVVAGAAACDDPSGADASRISILLTDAAGDEVTAAYVGISRIELMGGGAEAAGGAIVLRDTPWEGNVVELQNSFATLVGEVEIPSGHYTQVRIIFTGMCIEVDQTGDEMADASFATPGFDACGPSDELGFLQTPSFMQTGLKVKLPGGNFEVDGGTHIVLMDFDVSESFGHAAGNNDRWVAHPSIKASEFHLAASVTVNVVLNGAGLGGLSANDVFAAMSASLSGESMAVVQDGDGALTGSAVFALVVPGDYTVDVSATGFDLTALADVEVDGGSAATGAALPVGVSLGESGDAIVDVSVSGVVEE